MFTKFKPKSEFSRNVLTLMTGTTVAQAIPVAVSPILSRIYTPDDFGIFALFMSTTSLLVVIATGMYDSAILLPKNEQDAKTLVILSLLLSLIFSITVAFVIFIFQDNLPSIFLNTDAYSWIYIVPLSIFIFSFYQVVTVYANRNKRYRNIAISKVNQSFTAAIINLSNAIISVNYWGLIFGRLIGSIVAIVSLTKNQKIKVKINILDLKKQAKRYIKFPKYSLPADFSSILTNELPIFLFVTLYSSVTVGLYAFSLRVVGVPISIIGSSVAGVFRQEAAENFSKDGNCIAIFKKTAKSLFFIAIVPFTILAIYAPEIFIFIFGEEWALAGQYTQIMVIMYFFKFIVSPLSYMYHIAEKQKEDLYLHLYVLSSSFIAIYLGHHIFQDAYYSILFYSLNYMLIYLYTAKRSYYFAKGNL